MGASGEASLGVSMGASLEVPLGASLGASLPPQGGTAQEPLTTWTTLLLRIPLRTVPMQDSLKDILTDFVKER